MEKYCEYKKKYTEPSHRYNVFSVVVFLMEQSYKDPIKKYFENLRTYVSIFRKLFGETFYLRIYYDKSIYTPIHKNDDINKYITKKLTVFIDELNKYDYIQLVEYNCPKFLYKNIYHLGLYGTLQRFLPMFDFPENKNIDTVIIADVDSHLRTVELFRRQCDFMKENNYKFLYGSSCKPLQLYRRTGKLTRETNDYWMSAGRIITSIKFPRKLLLDFQETLLSNNEEIRKYFNRDYEYKKIYPTHDIQYVYSYGIDEYFLNHSFRDYMIEKNMQIVVNCVPRIIQIFWTHQMINDDYKNISKEDEDLLLHEFSEIFNKPIFPNISIKSYMTKIPEIQYNFPAVQKNICKFIAKIKNNYEKYLFTKELYEFAQMECCAITSDFYIVMDNNSKKIVCL